MPEDIDYPEMINENEEDVDNQSEKKIGSK